MLYTHVAILRRRGVEAWIVHHRSPFRLEWLASDAPISYLDRPAATPGGDDVLVVPDVLAASDAARGFPGERIVFVQGVFTILAGLGGAPDYSALGYERAMAVLPNVREVVERHFGVQATVVPPCITREFFVEPERLDAGSRARQILLTTAKVASPDRDVLTTLVARRVQARPGWSMLDLRGYSHGEVAHLMQTSAFLVNTNVGEAFNTTVPEAMAAGCVVLCYEAFGGRDFLRDGENANVFPNHYVFPLVDRLFALMDKFEGGGSELAVMRHRGYESALEFTAERTERALLRFFQVSAR
jgi:glycosyltransferase involved in cell wall biosynthesis